MKCTWTHESLGGGLARLKCAIGVMVGVYNIHSQMRKRRETGTTQLTLFSPLNCQLSGNNLISAKWMGRA